MGMLDENNSGYPAVKTKDPFEIAGEVWAKPAELRNIKSDYGESDWYVVPILPRGAARTEDNVVSLWVKPGARLAALKEAIIKAGDDDCRPGALIACTFTGETRKGKMGDIKVWRFEYRAPAQVSQPGSLLGGAAAPAETGGSSLLGD